MEICSNLNIFIGFWQEDKRAWGIDKQIAICYTWPCIRNPLISEHDQRLSQTGGDADKIKPINVARLNLEVIALATLLQV